MFKKYLRGTFTSNYGSIFKIISDPPKMNILIDNVPLKTALVRRTGKSSTTRILVDRNRDSRIIQYNRMNQTSCDPNEVHRTMQVLE